MSEQQIRNSAFDWNIGENSSEVLQEFPYVCNSFSAESFSSLPVEVPNAVVNCGNINQSRISQGKSDELFSLATESEKSGYGSGVNEDFFQSFNSSSCSYVEPNSESMVKHEMPTILNLDSNFTEALTNNFDLMNNSMVPPKSVNPADQPSVSYPTEFDSFNDDLFSRHYSDLSQCRFNSFDSSATKTEFYGRNALLNDGPEESMDNTDAPSEWSGIGGSAVLCRSLPEGSIELLSYMRVPDEAKKRKFLTVREMLNIKKKLSNAKNKVLKDFLTCSEDSQDEQDSSEGELTIHISPEPKDETLPSSPKKLRTTRASKRKKSKRQSNCYDFSDEESNLATSVDSHHFNNTLMLTPSNLANGLVPLPAFTDPVPLSTEWSQDFNDSNREPHFFPAITPAGQTGSSLSPKSREVFDFVHPVQQQIIGSECRNSYPDSYSRPRHFEFRLLQIGTYQFVASGNDTNERLSRLKIIFTTQKFVYEYELPSRIPYAHEGQVLVTRMISVEVPFSTVVGLDCNDTVVRMLVDTQPFVFIGYRTHYPDQSRCCVYERMADADFTHGELSTSPLHRLVLIRPEAANKLKYHLSNFNSRFASLLDLPFPVANHIPHWPLRQQTIFTIPKEQSSPTLSGATGVVSTVATFAEGSTRSTRKPCNCRFGCRSKKCSCARQGKPCLSDSGCRCNSCDNPLNVLHQWGVDIQWATKQSCLMDNIFNIAIHVLQERLQHCVTCPSCGISVNLIQIFVNSKADCPKCNTILCYSWCKGILLPAHSKTLYHCQICESCSPASHIHCEKCEVCVEFLLPSGVCSICNQPASCNPNATVTSLVPVQETKIW